MIAQESLEFEEWDNYVQYARTADLTPEEVDKADESRTVSTEQVMTAMKTLRFRDNFKYIIQEFAFHNLAYKNETSTLKYDQVLRAFVQNRMGHEALTLVRPPPAHAPSTASAPADHVPCRARTGGAIVAQQRRCR